MKARLSFLSPLVFLLVFPLFAPASAQVISDHIVVTASAVPETIESTPASATVITRDDLEAHAARDVADVLRGVPGVVMSRSGSAGRATSMFTRGSNSTHTLVLWNGIELTNPYFAGYDWGRFSTIGVEQVEVVRGPYSALYGSDALAGVVNVITTPAGSAIRADLESGGNGLRGASALASIVHGRSYATIAVESREDAGFAGNDDFAQESGTAMFRWAATDSLSAGVSLRLTDYELGIPKNLNAAGDALVPSPDRRQSGTERQIAIPVEQVLGSFSYELTLAESRRNDDFEDPDDPYGYVSSSTESSTRRARLTTRTETAFGTIVAGGEFERASVDDVTNFGPNLDGSRRDETSFFVENRVTRQLAGGSRIEASVGGRYDRFQSFGSRVSPRVAAALVTSAGKFRAGFGEAFRAPAIGELYFPFMGNPELGAERTRSIEAGYDRDLPGGRISATLFRSDYDGLIVFDLAMLRFGNVGRSNARGLELALDHRLSDSMLASASYTLTETEEEGFDRPLLRRPRHAGSLFVHYGGGAVRAALGMLYTGERADVEAVAPFSRTTNEAHTTFDLNVQYGAGRFTPYVKVENLTDVEYEEVLGYASPRRRVIAGVRFAM